MTIPQRGFTLIELMIAMSLGLVIVFAIITIMISSNRNAIDADSMSDTHETGRFAISVLSNALYSSGYKSSGPITPFADICANPANPVACTLEVGNGRGDQLAIRKVVSDDNDMSCAGIDLGLAVDTELEVIETYWIETDAATGLGTLRCRTYDSAGVPQTNTQSLVMGLEAVHILYGLRTTVNPDSTRNVSLYVAADDVTDWNNVLAVKIGLLVRSQNDNGVALPGQRYVLLDSEVYSYDDGVNREIYSTTVTRPVF